jgi:acetolactate synthase-1/3 small subunit
MQEEQFVLSVLVTNHFGVLTRVAGLFARRGYNIDSLTVGETENAQFSRMTIVATGDERTKDQIIKQLAKLHDVHKIELMESGNTVIRELMMVKIRAEADKRTEIMDAIKVYRAKVVDLSPEVISVELTGEKSKLDAFVEYVRQYGILELCRTGVAAIARGTDCLDSKNIILNKGEMKNGTIVL